MRRSKRMLVIPKNKDTGKKEVLAVLKAKGIKPEKIENELIGNELILWVHTSQEKKAKLVLAEKGIKSFTSDVVTVKLPDKPGELAKIARILGAQGIMVQDAHIIIKSQKNALYGITTNDPKETAVLLERFFSMVESEEKRTHIE